ncbi:MAG: minichromosome maintenance protein MCM [Candidatus Paceibacterota bacterium]
MNEDFDDLHAGDKTAQWRDFLKLKYKRQMAEIGREYPFKKSLTIDFREVEKFGSEGLLLADEILENPGKVVEDVHDAIYGNDLIRTKDGKPPKEVNVRFSGLREKTPVRLIRTDDVNRFIAIDCVILTVTEVLPRIVEAVFRCPRGHFTMKHQSYGKFIEPDSCGTDECTYKKLELMPKRSKYLNQQLLKVQETSEGLRPGQQPQTINVVVLDDICDQLYPGDHAVLNGIVRSTQRVVRGEKSTIFDLYFELSSIEAEKREFDEITITEESIAQIKEIAKSGQALEMVATSIAPSIYGYEDIKRGMALQMFGGVSSENSDGTINRGDIHVLILGDPGVAKSKLIKYASKQTPRGVFVSSVTSSGVGLTGMATRDENGRWTIEAGALPLADMGIAAVDEIDKADSDTIDSLLNIMEDGEVRITKAGQNRVLKARCSLICAGNPKDERFDLYNGDIVDQIDLPPAFMSRIDLPYLMFDTPEENLDRARSNHVIKTRYIAECRTAGKLDRISDEDLKSVEPPIPAPLLKQYIAYAKRTVTPIMNPQVRQYLTDHYVGLRCKQLKKSANVPTMRQQEALVRLAEAAAKIRLSPEVALKDAEAAITIFDNCMKAIATDPKTGQVDLGRIGHGVSQEKLNMIGVMREIMLSNPKCSKALLMAKMAERSFKNEHSILVALEKAQTDGDVMDRGRNEHYEWEGK